MSYAKRSILSPFQKQIKELFAGISFRQPLNQTNG